MEEREYKKKWAEANYKTMAWDESPQTDKEQVITRDDFLSDLKKACVIIRTKPSPEQSKT